ncbi:GL18087 [Drosophila persimilis]|uniref:GL18087 n=2 Tax=Drosophila persimilis TaxID=7234 RepID=B4HC40_DROPE|nr:GL18087 [Drosophila persimilis]
MSKKALVLAFLLALPMAQVSIGGEGPSAGSNSPFHGQPSAVSLSRLHCEQNPKYFRTLNVTIANNTIMADIYLAQGLKAGFRGHIDLQLRLTNAKKFQSLVQTDTDYCELLSSLKESLFRRWIHSVAKNSNFMENCPIPAGPYYLKGYQVDMSLVPSYLLNGDYRLRALVYYGKYRSKGRLFLLECTVEASMKN